jgi:hypothetical protein
MLQLKTGLKIDIDERVQATIDPDQWYKKATEKRRNLLLELDNCKRQTEQDIGFIGVIFVAGNESSNVEKLAIANELWTHKRSTDFVDVVKTYKSGAESRSNEAKQKLQEPRTKKNVWQSKLQQAEMELVRWKNIERTTYFLKILSDDKVEEVFGSVFNRLLRGRHGK